MNTNQHQNIKDFPDIETWRRTVIKPGDLPQYLRQDFYDYYKSKFKIALSIKPLSICEIGVRWGYSAFSFLSAAPAAHYTGFDIMDGTHGGARGLDTFDYVRSMLSGHFPQAVIDLRHEDTRKLRDLGGPYDFVHVDGDHSEDAASHDIWMALQACRPGGMVLVDDYNYIAGVTRAADYILSGAPEQIARHWTQDSLRGELILIKGEPK